MNHENNDFNDTNPAEDNDEDIVSRSQVKREAHAIQELGAAMIKLQASVLEKIPLPENIHDAIMAARKLKKGSALKRQVQYVGKLLRNSDDEESIRIAYEKAINPYREDTKLFHQMENWRDRLIAEGDKALEELIIEMPQIDRQHLRQLIRNAKKEKEKNKPPKSSREIFQYLKQLMTQEE